MPNPIIIKDLSLGIIPDFTSNNKAVEGAEGQYTKTTGIDLFRPNFQGHITPAGIFNLPAPDTHLGGGLNSLAQAATVDVTTLTNSNLFVFYILGGLNGIAPRWLRMVNNNPISTDAFENVGLPGTHASHNFTTLPTDGTGTWGEDVAVYLINGVPYMFYSWNDNTDGDVGTILMSSTSTQDDDFMSTQPTTGAVLQANVPHRLVEGSDKKLYITNGRYIASYDGSVGSFTTAGTFGLFTAHAYDLGAGWIATDIRVDKDYLAISGVRTNSFNYFSFWGKSKVCYARVGESGFAIVYDIPDSFISSLYSIRGIMHAFTIGKNGTSKIINVFTGETLTEWPSSVYGKPPKPNSVDMFDNKLVWIPQDALSDYVVHYSIGGGIHVPYLLNNGTNDSTQTSGGMLKNIDGNNLYVAGKYPDSSTGYSITYLDGISSGFASSKDLRTRLFRIGYKSVIKKIQVFFSQMESGSSATFSIFKNYVATGVGGANDMLAGSIPSQTVSYASNGSLTEYEINCTIPTSSFYLNVRVTGQISIAEIVVYWDYLR